MPDVPPPDFINACKGEERKTRERSEELRRRYTRSASSLPLLTPFASLVGANRSLSLVAVAVAAAAVLLNFGNVKADNNDVMVKVRTIAAEAEIVATRIYGKGMSNKEQQDRAWKQESTSIFDLER